MKIELPVSLELLPASEWAFEIGAGGVAQLKGVRATSRMPDGHFNYTSHINYRDLLGSLHPALVFSAQETKFAFSVGTGRGDLDHKVLVPIGVDGAYRVQGNFSRQEQPKPKERMPIFLTAQARQRRLFFSNYTIFSELIRLQLQ